MEDSFHERAETPKEKTEELDSPEVLAEKAKIRDLVKSWQPLHDLHDDFRHPDAHKDGGFPLNDAAVIGKYR